MPQVTEWQNRPLDTVYPFIFMDAIHYKIRENHQIVTKAGICLNYQKWFFYYDTTYEWITSKCKESIEKLGCDYNGEPTTDTFTQTIVWQLQ
jgi:hypothetical protein